MPKPRLSDIRIKAVIAGVIADNAGTLLIMSVLAALLVARGLSEDEVMLRMKSTNGLLLGIILGLCCTIGGAFLAGSMAGRAEPLHGALVAAIGMVLMLIFRDGGDPLWFEIVAFGGMLPAGTFGGYLAQKRRETRAGVNKSS